MITYEIINSSLSAVNLMDEDLVLHDIEDIVEQFGLTITQKTTLSTLKGSIHSESLALQFEGKVKKVTS